MVRRLRFLRYRRRNPHQRKQLRGLAASAGLGPHGVRMTLPSFTCPQLPVFGAPDGIVVQVPAGELTSVIQTLSQQLGMGYPTELSQRREVNCQPVKLDHDQRSYLQEGRTPAGAALLDTALALATEGIGRASSRVG